MVGVNIFSDENILLFEDRNDDRGAFLAFRYFYEGVCDNSKSILSK